MNRVSPTSRVSPDGDGSQTGVRSTRRLAVARGAGAVASGVGLAAGAAGSAAAHHSYPATYDTAQRVTVTGTVQLVRFVNPHVHVVIEEPLTDLVAPAEPPPPVDAAPVAEGELYPEVAPAEEGGVGLAETDAADAEDVLPIALSTQVPSTLWLLDGPSPAQAQRIGLTPENLPPGTSLTVTAWPARNPGSHDLAPITITLHNGFQIRVR